MDTKQLEAILKDKSLAEEIQKRVLSLFPSKDKRGLELKLPAEREIRKRVVSERGLEAIVLQFGRPSLLVINGTFEVPSSDIWKSRLSPTKKLLDDVIRSVGRVEIVNHPSEFVGTAWMIAESIVVTNRHVAEIFSQKNNDVFSFLRNSNDISYDALIDFKEEFYQPEGLELKIQDILYVADDEEDFPDLAFLKIENNGSHQLPPPIPLQENPIRPGQIVAAIGYPEYDNRNDAKDMNRIFGNRYGVKRFAPGKIKEVFDERITHDCTTLGGNSGSIVTDIYTGEAVGLHFAGEYLKENYAVSASALREYLKDKVKINQKTVPVGNNQADDQKDVSAISSDATIERPRPKLEEIKKRKGYDSKFLGDTDELVVHLPNLSSNIKEEVAIVEGATKNEEHILRYTNFSIVMNEERRLAFYTATNIDGEQAKRVKRKGDHWYFDQRISQEAQVGDELYRGSGLDRGHLTRRLDPVWGKNADEAEGDTFFFTNCTPQHHKFNRKMWLELESYLLDNIEMKDFRASVFTGPVFSDSDPRFEFHLNNGEPDSILLPLQYWKVVVMVNEKTGKLSATAYLMSQKDLISNLEFVFGQFNTYQVPISHIEKLTELDFGTLKAFDPLGVLESVTIKRLTRLGEIVT